MGCKLIIMVIIANVYIFKFSILVKLRSGFKTDSMVPSFSKLNTADNMTKFECISFNLELLMKIESWLFYFDKLCTKKWKDDLKVDNIFKLLESSALTILLMIV